MTEAPSFLTDRPDVHSKAASARFAYVAEVLEATVGRLIDRSSVPRDARVLDYGSASSPYRALLPAAVEFVGADLPGNEAADVVLLPDGTVPLPPDSFDLVLSTQVLEHVPDPSRYLAECRRLLKPGGTLVLTTHGIMYYHPDPHDFWRWTREGLSQVVSDEGLEIVEMCGVLGIVAAALQLIQDATLGRIPRRARPIYTAAMQKLISGADRRYSDESRLDNSMVLAVRAVKPQP